MLLAVVRAAGATGRADWQLLQQQKGTWSRRVLRDEGEQSNGCDTPTWTFKLFATNLSHFTCLLLLLCTRNDGEEA
jgi:hypothetical protein